jgi:di/tricarboxylate transporter
MKRNLSSSLGALHPILFMLMVYVISVVLAFFVCTTIYNSINDPASVVLKEAVPAETLTALK